MGKKNNNKKRGVPLLKNPKVSNKGAVVVIIIIIAIIWQKRTSLCVAFELDTIIETQTQFRHAGQIWTYFDTSHDFTSQHSAISCHLERETINMKRA